MFRNIYSALQSELRRLQADTQLETLVKLLIEEVAEQSKCIVSIVDSYYRRKININDIRGPNILPTYRVRYKLQEY